MSEQDACPVTITDGMDYCWVAKAWSHASCSHESCRAEGARRNEAHRAWHEARAAKAGKKGEGRS